MKVHDHVNTASGTNSAEHVIQVFSFFTCNICTGGSEFFLLKDMLLPMVDDMLLERSFLIVPE